MILGLPLSGRQDMAAIPEWVPLRDALAEGKIKISAKIPKTDWRSRVAAADASWTTWWDVEDGGEVTIGVGLIAHGPSEGDVRKAGFVTVRPFTRSRTKIAVAQILGALDIPDKERHLWADVDGVSPEAAAPQLRHGPWWIVRSLEDTGEPATVFSPARWGQKGK